MEKYIILGDAAGDISAEIREYFGVIDYVPGHVHYSDGRDFATTLDWSLVSREQFYKDLSNKKLQVTTSPANPEEQYLYYKKYVEQGYKILSMSLSSKISSTYSTALVAAERIKKEYPDCTVYCCDTLRMAGAFGLLVMYAHQMQKEGASFDEVVAWVENNKMRVHQMGPIDDLIAVARRGRISMGKAIMGNFAGVKPMADCSSDGYVAVVAKVKGISKALDATVQYVKKMATDVEDQYLLVSHTDRQAYAENLKAQLEKELNPKKVFISDVFTACGPNIGPGMVGVYFLGPEVSEDQSVEREAILSILDKK